MNIIVRFLHALAIALLTAAPLLAEVQVRVSIKAILGPNDEWPSNSGGSVNLNSEQEVRDTIDFINSLLTRRGESFRLFLRGDTVHTVEGQSDPWFTIAARDSGNRADLEATATASAASRATWHWHDDSINIYINDTSSGVCAFPGGGNAILIGAQGYVELIIHEIGHYLSLRHTHNGDNDGDLNDWGDGDGFSETLDDDSDASAADINDRYPGQSQQVRDDLIFNIMSYHQPQDRFVWQQRQGIIETYNGARDSQASGEGRFVKSDGNDLFDGKSHFFRLKTLEKADELSTSSNDVMLLDGTQEVEDGTIFSKPMTWLKWRNNALIK